MPEAEGENRARCEEYEKCPDFGYLTRFTAYRDEDIREGLRRVEAGEGEEWLGGGQAERWTCPRYDYPLTWYDNKCRRCGEKVREEPITWTASESNFTPSAA